MKPLTHEARRFCHGDYAWSNWQPCTAEQAERYAADETFQVRERVCPRPAPHKQPPPMPNSDTCCVNQFSSRCCEYGTKGCVVTHNPEVQASPLGVVNEEGQTMTEEMQAALREWVRGNLVVDVQNADKLGPGRDVYVGLRFKDEDRAFSYSLVGIPSGEDA